EAQLERSLGSPAPRNQEETRRDDRIARHQHPITIDRPPARRLFVQRAVGQVIIEPAIGLKLERRSDFHLPAVVNAREGSRLRRSPDRSLTQRREGTTQPRRPQMPAARRSSHTDTHAPSSSQARYINLSSPCATQRTQ